MLDPRRVTWLALLPEFSRRAIGVSRIVCRTLECPPCRGRTGRHVVRVGLGWPTVSHLYGVPRTSLDGVPRTMTIASRQMPDSSRHPPSASRLMPLRSYSLLLRAVLLNAAIARNRRVNAKRNTPIAIP
jgi:hypothetical protein